MLIFSHRLKRLEVSASSEAPARHSVHDASVRSRRCRPVIHSCERTIACATPLDLRSAVTIELFPVASDPWTTMLDGFDSSGWIYQRSARLSRSRQGRTESKKESCRICNWRQGNCSFRKLRYSSGSEVSVSIPTLSHLGVVKARNVKGGRPLYPRRGGPQMKARVVCEFTSLYFGCDECNSTNFKDGVLH